MLAQRFIVKCDEEGCKARTKGTLRLLMKPVGDRLGDPIVLQPHELIIEGDGWVYGWDGKYVATYCPEHKKNHKRIRWTSG